MTKTKPTAWTVGSKIEGGWTVARVRQFFAVLKSEDKPAKWAVQTIDGKITKASSSADAGVRGRAYRDAQKAKGITVERTRTAPAKKAPAKKAPAKAPAKKATARKAPAKKRA